ncbi:Ankyrin-1 [Dactylella cylindrospora]|nr:Ankyrin-1 [Dactylella cylindrospora]
MADVTGFGYTHYQLAAAHIIKGVLENKVDTCAKAGENCPGGLLNVFTFMQILAFFAEPNVLKLLFFQGYRLTKEDPSSISSSRIKTCPLSPLQCAAISGNLECVKLMINNGADVREPRSVRLGFSYYQLWKTGPGGTALHFAVQYGHLDIAKYLVEHGADIYAFTIPVSGYDQPETVVEFAVRLRRLDFIALFLLVDINCRDLALNAAMRNSHFDLADWIKNEWFRKQDDSDSCLGATPIEQFGKEDSMEMWGGTG